MLLDNMRQSSKLYGNCYFIARNNIGKRSERFPLKRDSIVIVLEIAQIIDIIKASFKETKKPSKHILIDMDITKDVLQPSAKSTRNHPQRRHVINLRRRQIIIESQRQQALIKRCKKLHQPKIVPENVNQEISIASAPVNVNRRGLVEF